MLILRTRLSDETPESTGSSTPFTRYAAKEVVALLSKICNCVEFVRVSLTSHAAPRSSWSHRYWQEVSWSWKGSRLQPHYCRPKKDLEETQHPQPLEIQISVWIPKVTIMSCRVTLTAIRNPFRTATMALLGMKTAFWGRHVRQSGSLLQRCPSYSALVLR